MGELYDAPNQQVVRADGSAPWDEGTGGDAGELPTAQAQADESKETEPQQASEPQQAASQATESSEASQERQRQSKGRRSA